MKKHKAMTKLVVALAALVGASQAQATTYTIGGEVNKDLEAFSITYKIPIADNGPGIKTESGLAGAISMTDVSRPATKFWTVCTDVGGIVYLNQNYDYNAPAVFSGQDGLNPSWGAGNQNIPKGTEWADLTPLQQENAYAAINAAANIFKSNLGDLTSTSVTKKAAVQLAVWEALYDTDVNNRNPDGTYKYDLSSGGFKVNSGDTVAISDAALLLGKVDQKAKYTGFLLIPQDTGAQEMLYDITPVPEPTTVLAGALLLLPFGMITLGKMRKNRIV